MNSRELAKLCEADGWTFDRQKGSHMVYVKEGVPRPIVVPERRGDVEPFVVSLIKRQLAEARRRPPKPQR
jgi:predicted RNA binding protein YcfA (HicA-like mRNA interferase family)